MEAPVDRLSPGSRRRRTRSPGRRLGFLLFLPVVIGASASEAPVARWKFDYGTAADAAGGVKDAIKGNCRFMPEGVPMGCLRFDGFTTLVRCEAVKVPDLTRGFTVQDRVGRLDQDRIGKAHPACDICRQ
jgi:hypothetical protein